MTFRMEYAEQILRKLTNHVRNETNEEAWHVNVLVSKLWHFRIDYVLAHSGEVITITHKHRGLKLVIENGVMTNTKGLRRFDMLFASLHTDLITQL